MVARRVDHHEHSQGHHKNVDVTHKPLSSLPPYHMPLRAFIMSEGDLFSKTQNLMFKRCSVARIYKYEEPTNSRNKQTADYYNNV
jgi:hypothetical protein